MGPDVLQYARPPFDLVPMQDDHDSRQPRDERSSVERFVDLSLIDTDPRGRPLARSAMQRERSVEAYLQSGVRPRWMERVVEIDQGIASEKRRIERVYRTLQRELRHDPHAFAERWTARAHSWSFDWLNELIEQHNDWFPIERRLPMDPRTGDYVPIGGRSYRRPILGPEWILEHFPAALPADR
jgi:hypothetical protein